MDFGLGCLVNLRFVHPHRSTCRAWCVTQQWAHIPQSAGRMQGPLRYSDHVCISPIRLVPKGLQRHAQTMIVDLSHPCGQELSEKIPSDLCPLRCPSVHDAVDYILALGRYTQLVRVDLKGVCRILPIHREESQFAIWPALRPKELHSLC